MSPKRPSAGISTVRWTGSTTGRVSTQAKAVVQAAIDTIVIGANTSRRPRRFVIYCRLVAIRAVISDFGGVLTTPLLNSFAAFQDETGIPTDALGRAMQRISERDGAHPLFELERGKLTESRFLDLMRAELAAELGHKPQLHRFSEIYFEALDPNEAMIGLMRELKGRGCRMALLTNNVREWEPLWRAMLPVDEIFELVVDSAFVGMRKPDPEIYELTLERLGGLEPESCLFVDDLAENVASARELGMEVVHFRSNEQAIPEIEAALG